METIRDLGMLAFTLLFAGLMVWWLIVLFPIFVR